MNSAIAGTDSLACAARAQVLAQDGARRRGSPVQLPTLRRRPGGETCGRLEAERDVGLGERALHVVAARARACGRTPARSAARASSRRGGVEVGARLVEQQQRRVVEHRAGDGQRAAPSRARARAPGRRRAAPCPTAPSTVVDARRGRRRAVGRGSAGSRARSGRGRAAARGRGSRPAPRSFQRSRAAPRRARARARRAGAAARRARAAASSCRRRCRRTPRSVWPSSSAHASRPPSADALAVAALEAVELDRSHAPKPMLQAEPVARMVGINHIVLGWATSTRPGVLLAACSIELRGRSRDGVPRHRRPVPGARRRATPGRRTAARHFGLVVDDVPGAGASLKEGRASMKPEAAACASATGGATS